MTTSLTDWNPPPQPERAPIAGRLARLEPLDAARHGGDLWSALDGADEVWRFMADGPFTTRAAFVDWLAQRAATFDPLSFAVIDAATGAARGMLSLMAIRPQAGVVELGAIVFAPALQRTAAATEAIYLAMRYVFDLGYRRVEWKCDERNAASKRAARRFGFMFEGLFHQHMIVKGENRDTAWFALLDHEWPAQKLAFESWLAADNFNADGAQRRRLMSFMRD